MKVKVISHKYLTSLFSYNPEDGLFTRIKARQGTNGAIGCVAGTVNPHGYVMINILGSLYAAHRLAWYYETGEYPAFHLDHVDQDKTNNRISNIRKASYAVNARNMPMRSDNKSGQVGVSWDSSRSKWYVRISVDGKNKFIGYRGELVDAIELRKKAEKECGYHANHGKVVNN